MTNTTKSIDRSIGMPESALKNPLNVYAPG